MKYLILTTLLLTSCQSKKIDQRIYQPSILLIPPFSQVVTTEGIYMSSDSIERWYPAKKVEDLERRLSQF